MRLIPSEDEPDFKNMTPDQLRDGLQKLNTQIKALKRLNPDNVSFYVDELEQRRKKYKEVWRARPGRPFRDVAARVQREKDRKVAKIKKAFGLKPKP